MPLQHVKSVLLLALSLTAVVVLDGTATPARRLWYEELARLRRQIDKLPSDYQKTTFLREYVGGLTMDGRPTIAPSIFTSHLLLKASIPLSSIPSS